MDGEWERVEEPLSYHRASSERARLLGGSGVSPRYFRVVEGRGAMVLFSWLRGV